MLRRTRPSCLIIVSVCVVSIVIFFSITRNANQSQQLILPKNQIDNMDWFRGTTLGFDANKGVGIRISTLMTDLNETGLPFDIVPNIVHYILFTVHEIEFAHFVSILSVLKNQRPERIYIHCDCHQLTGDYWQRTLWLANKTNTKVTVRYVEKPTEIFGHKLSQKWLLWHSSDVMRIRLLQEFGGIYLDRDVYVVKPLNTFFKYEMTLEWDRTKYIGSQVLIAHRNARFLKLWLETYHNYDPKQWYFVGVYATDHILRSRPELIHRTRHEFADDGQEVCPKLFNTYSNGWQQFHAIHLFIRGDRVTLPEWCFARLAKQPAVQQFNETNIYQLRTAFAEMARIVFDFEKSFK